MPPLETRTDSPGDTPEVPKIHVSTGEESSDSGIHSTQDLRPRHRRERNPERPPSNSHGDWPFLRPPERDPEVPDVSREHLPLLEKIQEVLPSRRDEAHFRCSASRLITPKLWNFQRVLHTLAATQEVPRHTRLHQEQARESGPHPEVPRFCLLAREEGSFSCVVGKEFPAFPSHLKWRRSTQERREELQGRATFPESPRCLSLIQGNLFSLHCLDFQAEDRLTPRWHVGKPRGKASWESLEGKPLIP